MNVVTIGVSSVKEVRRRTAAAFRGGRQGSHISFASEELLWKTLTPKRWALLKIMAGQGPLSIREIARRVERDVRAVHSDVHALLKAGVLDRVDDGRVKFGYDAIHVDFVMHAAA
ncbi:MAG: transcriptional regulator [Proteobacteria bacterium]|nr:transcriptional regulator [Pseudomonadota bacterium]